MNRALFLPEEIQDGVVRLPRSDRRAEHIRSVLRAAVGDRVQVGMVNGQRGEAEVGAVDRSGVVLRRLLLPQPPDVLYPITLQLGHPRPIVLRRILKDAATAGFCRIDIIRSQLGERSYMESSLWQDERQLQELLVLGAEQAGGSRIPELRRFWSLDRCLQKGGYPDTALRFLLHPGVPGSLDLSAACTPASASGSKPGSSTDCREVLVAIGSERGWSEGEVQQFLHAGYRPVGLGDRILRTETAVQWAISRLICLVSGN
ncbi:16S rRNA (uracil(1498)-N(3))-methyltransferase [Spirochaeta africana]|uniref:Ribosomal RNA small subunit methyltransferase E n=1 Tax=Spirochaeta africana (strain ATCC 700263 / DSM 8902 / Z-7692) TaxID=889378 RepID=H9UKP6_SPIAZ|nr:RsmE family RNA methyltransferase [Spirochaeta africana]AFG38089.1 RNA methyltransferase, RsmE family [Spirochaeta africana DSM 8902]